MPATVTLTTMPGTKQRGRRRLVLDLFGASLDTEVIAVRKTAEIAPAVRLFGERVRAAHPDASFNILLHILRGQRKLGGYDVAERVGAFGANAFMHVTNTADFAGGVP